MKNFNSTLEFNTIRDKLKDFAHSDTVKNDIDNLKPFLNEDDCRRRINETTAARKILDALGLPPLPYSSQIISIVELCQKGELPTPDQLISVRIFADSCQKMVKYLGKSESLDIRISSFGRSMNDLSELEEEILRCITNDGVDSRASDYLEKTRRDIEKAEEDIKTKAEKVLGKNKNWYSEGFVSKRNGHYVLPVKKQFKNQFKGSVIEVSGSGGTYFMEPEVVGKLQDELSTLTIMEEDEVRRILYSLSALVCQYDHQMRSNIDMVNQLDMIFAKGRLSQAMNGSQPNITTKRIIKLMEARHPLLDPEKCVPLNFQMNEGTQGVIITGPNTGGKTVALKTVGLLSLMAQCGLHIPANKDNTVAMHSSYMCDIGDSQSISENLSTFSGHMTNIIDILENVDQQSLVIIDELGSGTDPSEGMGIAIAVMEELRRSRCMFLVSTHYPQVKDYSKNTEGVLSARMAFDKKTLTPLYKLEMGETGDSCALDIAKELGLSERILKEAHDFAYSQENKTEYGSYAGKRLDHSKNEDKRNKKKLSQSKIKPSKENDTEENPKSELKMGDSVKVPPDNQVGIVYKPADDKGDVCVQIKGKKQMYNYKRVKLHLPAESLYPEDYDMSIVFDSVENRKAKNKLDKGNPTGVIEYDDK